MSALLVFALWALFAWLIWGERDSTIGAVWTIVFMTALFSITFRAAT